MSARSANRGPFVHQALLYRTAHEYLHAVVQFVAAGLAAGEPVLVAAPTPALNRLSSVLPATNGRVQLLDMAEVGRNPGQIIPGVLLKFAATHPDRHIRIVGEPLWPGRTDAEYPACVQHEALANLAFAGQEVTLLCPYNAARLPSRAIEDAARTHPLIGTQIGGRTSSRFRDPLAVATAIGRTVPDPPEIAHRLAVDVDALPEVRRFVVAHASAAGLAAHRLADLTIAVNELATNSMLHTSGPGTLAAWTTDRQLICQITDNGFVADPLAGRVPPAANHPGGGRGLVLVNALCDLVRLHTRPGRTAVRVHMHRR